jgi:hypothetical protein
MMKSISKLIVAGMVASGSFLVGQSVLAHHSTVGQISSEVTEITGTVKEFQFKNPHSWIQVDVTGDDGAVVEWSVEWTNPNNLLRQGHGPNTFPAGAEVTIKLRQHFSGKPLGEFNAARFADGTTVGNWSGA